MAKLTEAYLKKMIKQVMNENAQGLIYKDNFSYLGSDKLGEINRYVQKLHQGLNNPTTKQNVEKIINTFKSKQEFVNYFDYIDLNTLKMADFTGNGGLIHQYLNSK